jgi:hypothetical protein
VNRAASGYSLVATASGLQPGVSNAFDVAVGAPAQLVFTQQPATAVAPGATLPAVKVSVEDAAGNVVTSATTSISLTLGGSGGTLSGGGAVSAVAGVATFSSLSINNAGTYTLIANGGALLPATSSSISVGSATTGGASKLVFTMQPASTTAGAPMNVTVQVQDASGNLVTSATNPITVALFTNPGSATIGGTKTVAASAGVANFSLSVNRPGSGYSLAATATGLSVGVSNAFDITVGAAAQVAFLSGPTNTQSGSPIPTMTVAVEDSQGNQVATSGVVIALTLTDNTTGGTLTGTAMQATNASGVATFSGLSVGTAGTYTLTPSATGLSGVKSGFFTITTGATTGAAAGLKFAMQPASITAGGAESVTVQVVDSNGNVVNTATNTISISLVGGSGSGGGLVGTTTVNAVAGTASFNVNINQSGNGFFLVATSPGLAVGTSNSFNVAPGSASKLVFLNQPANAGVSSAISPAVQVAIEDSAGNIITSSSATITLALGMAGSATLTGGSASASMGVATFNNLKVDTAGTYTLMASSSGLSGAISNSFQIGSASSGNGNKLVFTGQPSTTGAGGNIAVTVQVQDQNGNLITTASNTITVSLFTNPTGDSLQGTRVVNAVNGVANFTLNLQRAGSGYSFAATASGLNVGLSVAFDVVPGAEAKLAFLVQPPFNPTAGQAFMPAPSVVVTDQFGNEVTTAMDTITLTLGNNMSGAMLSGTKVVAAMGVSGAVFPGLSIDKVQNSSSSPSYVLIASAPGLTSVNSNSINVVGGAATQLVFTQQPSNTTAGMSMSVTVAAVDAFGNASNSTNGTVSFQLMQGATPVGTPQSVSMFSGTASLFEDITTAGTFTLTAAMTGFTTVSSNSFTVAAGPASRLTFVVQPSNTLINATITPAVQVGIADNFGNVISTASDTITLQLQQPCCSNSATLGGTLSLVTSMGVASFANLTVNKTGSGYSLGAHATTSNFSSFSNGFTILSGPPTKLVFVGQPPANTTAGNTFNVQVAIEDSMGNIATTATTPISLSINPVTPINGLVTNVTPNNGVAAFSISINKANTGYALTAAASTLPSVVSNSFNVNGGSPTALAFTVQPSNGKTFAPISPTVTLSEVDQFGNVTNFPRCIPLSLSLKPPTAHLQVTPASGSGCASYPLNVEIDKVGTFQLVATDLSTFNPFPAVTSNSFTIGAGAWTPVNSGLDGGWISAIAIDPVTPANIYASAQGGGLYKSTNGGTSWTALDPTLDVTAIAINPMTPTTLLVGTSSGLYQSTDSGTTFSYVNINNLSYTVSAVTYAPSAASVIYVATGTNNSQAFRSIDGGTTWTSLSSFYASAIAVDPTNANTLYFAQFGQYLYKSIDGGTTTTFANSGSGDITGIAVDPVTPTTVYMSRTTGMYKSTNGGGQWNFVTTGMTNTQLQALAMSPSSSTTLYAATQFTGTPASIVIYKTTDGATTWAPVSSGALATRPVQTLAIDSGNNVYAGTQGGGVYKSTNGGTSWVAATTGISATEITSLIAPSPTKIYAAAYGAGIYTSTNGGTSWAQTVGQPQDSFINVLAVAPSNSQLLWAAGAVNDVWFSTNGGTSWTLAATSPNEQVFSFAVHPTNPMIVYAATQFDLWQSLDGGNNWTQTNSGLGTINAIAFDRNSANTLYAGTGSGFEIGTFNGTTMTWSWQANSLGLNSSQIFAFAQGPQAPGDFFAASFADLYHASMLPPNWSDVAPLGTASQTQFTAVLFDPNTVGVAYAAGTGIGVYRTANDGTSVVYAGSGLFNPNVQSLVHDPTTSNTLYAGTQGAGVWKTTTGGL